MALREWQYHGGRAVNEDGKFRCTMHTVPIGEAPSPETIIELMPGGILPLRCKVCEKQGKTETSVWVYWRANFY